MTDTPEVAIDQLDELDLTNVDTNRPLIKEGTLVKFKLTKIEVKDNSKKTGKNAQVHLALVDPLPAKDTKNGDRDLKPGFTLIETVSLVPTENYKPTERLAQIQECFTGVKGKWNTQDIMNREGTCRIGIESDPQYGDRNRVRSYVKKKAETVATLA